MVGVAVVSVGSSSADAGSVWILTMGGLSGSYILWCVRRREEGVACGRWRCGPVTYGEQALTPTFLCRSAQSLVMFKKTFEIHVISPN